MIEIKEIIKPYVVREVINFTEATYLLRFSRNGMKFKPGQHLVAGLMNKKDAREYSIYSGIHDEYLEILVREVENGVVSRKLKRLEEGDTIEINGPYGFFMYNTFPPESKKFLFIASGTGIAPFHSFVKSYPGSDYTLIHGIRTCDEAYQRSDYRSGRYIACTSRDKGGDFNGRLTDYLQTAEIDPNVMIYLCGNSQMILDSIEILVHRGFKRSQIFTEVYF